MSESFDSSLLQRAKAALGRRTFAKALALLGAVMGLWASVALAKPGFTDGQFIVPNEVDFQAYSQLSNPQDGALVSVGTFRGLIAMGQMNLNLLVQMDLDSGIVAFNQFNREILKDPQVGDRFSYLLRLFAREQNASLLKQAREHQISETEFLERLWLLPETSLSGKSLMEEKVRILMNAEFRAGTGDLRSKYHELYRDFLHVTRNLPGAWEKSYLGSDTDFQKIKKLALENRIVIFQGSLTDEKSFGEIKDILRERKSKLAILDVSNVFDYIQDKEPLQEFTAGLRRLPFTEDGSVLITRPGAGHRSTLLNRKLSPMWTYFQMSANQFSLYLKGENGIRDLTPQAPLKEDVAPLIVNLLNGKILYRGYQVLSCDGAFLR